MKKKKPAPPPKKTKKNVKAPRAVEPEEPTLPRPIDMWDGPAAPPVPTKALALLLATIIKSGTHVMTAFRMAGITRTLAGTWLEHAQANPNSDEARLFRVLDAADASVETALVAMLPHVKNSAGLVFLLQHRFPHWSDKGTAIRTIEDALPRQEVRPPSLAADKQDEVLQILKDLKIVTTTADVVEEDAEDEEEE